MAHRVRPPTLDHVPGGGLSNPYSGLDFDGLTAHGARDAEAAGFQSLHLAIAVASEAGRLLQGHAMCS